MTEELTGGVWCWRPSPVSVWLLEWQVVKSRGWAHGQGSWKAGEVVPRELARDRYPLQCWPLVNPQTFKLERHP